MNVEKRTIDLLSIFWLLAGIVVFLLGWCRWYYSLPLTLGIVAVVYTAWKDGDKVQIYISKNNFWLSFAVCLLIMWLCGIGGYVVQSADHYWRNAMFRDLVNYSWPVYDEATHLTKSYYIAFWMVPALLAKLAGSIEFGFFMQLVWLTIGFELLYLQISRWMGKARVSYLFFFYLFSVMKIVECLLYLPIAEPGQVISQTVNLVSTNATPGEFHAGPMSQLLYDPFNQTIPLFLGMMLMINNVRSKILPFVFASLLLYAPFPMVGLAPVVLYWMGRNVVERSGNEKWKYLFCFENVVALLVLVVLAFYLMSNNQNGNKGLRELSDFGVTLYGYFIYIFFEFVIFMLIGYKVCRDKTALWIAFVTVAVFGWFKIGLHNDFCFRTNMPLIFILCLLVIRRYYAEEANSRMRKLIVALYIIGGLPAEIHPTLRWLSSACIVRGVDQSVFNRFQHVKDVKTLYVMQQTKIRNDQLPSSFRCRKEQEQFRTDVGTKDSFFFKHLAK